MKKLLPVFFLLSAFFSCDLKTVEGDKSLLPKSSGKFGEVLIVVDTLYENRQTGEALDKIFNQALVGLPQQESQFRVSTVPPKAFQSILKRGRNILKLSIGSNKKTAINIEDDVWAKDQLLIQITAGSDTDAARILDKNAETIRNYFNEKEIERLQKQFAGKTQKKLMKEFSDKHKVNIKIPPGFVKMAQTDSSFWIRKEKSIGEHQILQGISVFYEPYTTKKAFDRKYMADKRNSFTAINIQGTRDSSHMQIYADYKPDTLAINLQGNYAMEYRGLWNMKNDFMGGPFLQYTLVDEKNNRVVHLDGFVYAPKFNKREYLR